MKALDRARQAAPTEILDERPRTIGQVEARVMTTLVLPAEALTIVAPPPEMISQLNVEQVLGIPSRAYLELLREPGCPLDVIRLGKLRLVELPPLRAWLRSRTAVRDEAPTNDAESRCVAGDDALDEFDLKAAPGARRQQRRKT